MKDRALIPALQIGIAAPILYFGIQLLAAPFFPGYSFLSMIASVLGSDQAVHPAIFNIGAMVTGIATIIAAIGFLLGLRHVGANPLLAWLAAIAVFLNGVGSLWAGFFPLPDPRHQSNAFVLGILLFPVLLAVALWKVGGAGRIKTYLLITIPVGVAVLATMNGAAGVDTQGYEGLFQRIFALIFFLPIAVGSYFLLQRAAHSAEPTA